MCSTKSTAARTPLHLALALAKDYNISRLLLEQNGDLHNRNADHRTPLHTFYSPVVKQVLSCHSDCLDLSAADRHGMSILHFLAWSSKTSSDEFRDFHERSHISLYATNTDGLSLLHLAAQRGNIAIIQYITHASTTTTTTTPPTTTATRNLLHLQDRKGRTALHHAVENKRGAQAAGILLSSGADMSARDQDGRTALHHAAKLGRLPAVEQLVAALESAHLLHAVDTGGLTARTVAMLHARDDVVTFLSGHMATPVEMDAQMVTKYYSCGNVQWAGGDARDKVSADLLSSSSSSSSSSEKWEIARWVERRRWPMVEMPGYARQLNIRYFLMVCSIMSMMVMWRLGAIMISPF